MFPKRKNKTTKYRYAKWGAGMGAVSFVLWLIVLALFVTESFPFPIKVIKHAVCDDNGICNYDTDAITLAVTLGRLDIVSAALTFVAIGVGFFALFTFIALKEDSRRIAEDTVDEIVEDEIEKAINRKRGEIERWVETKVGQELERTVTAAPAEPGTEGATPMGGDQ